MFRGMESHLSYQISGGDPPRADLADLDDFHQQIKFEFPDENP